MKALTRLELKLKSESELDKDKSCSLSKLSGCKGTPAVFKI